MSDLLLKAWIKTRLALKNYASDNRGVTAIEYAVIAVAVSALVIAVFGNDGDGSLKKALTDALGNITTSVGTPKP